MSRIPSRVAVALGLLVLAAALAPAQKPPPAAAPALKAVGLAERLEQPVTFSGFDDPKTTLGEAVDFLKRWVPVEVNEAAFQQAGLNDAAASPVAERPVAGLKEVPLRRVLDRVLARVNVDGGATYLIRPDHVELTTTTAARADVWGDGFTGPFLPRVHARFANRPLAQALADQADQSGYNVVLDARAGEVGQAPVTASFVNLPLDTAVSLLADMAGLPVTRKDNLLYVGGKGALAVPRASEGAAEAAAGAVCPKCLGQRVCTNCLGSGKPVDYTKPGAPQTPSTSK